MNYRRRALEGLLCLLYLVAIAVSARENECSDILQQGIYDQYKITSKSAFQAKVKEFFSKSWDQLSDAKLFANRSALFANDAESAMTAVRRQIRNHGPALLPDGTDPDVGQQTNTDLHRSLLDLRGTRSCAERVLLAFWGAAPNKHRSGARWERSYCSQRRRSIRYARADRHPGTHQLRKQLGPLADHNRVREHQGAPRQISLSKLFANSIATFAFISARSAHIRRYFWN